MTNAFSTQKKLWCVGAVIAACAFFFFAYSFLNYSAPLRFNSPDESSNYFFASLFAQTGKLWYFDELNTVVPGLVHPRSVRVVGDFLVPGAFLGIPVLYGLMAKVVSIPLLPSITPFLSVLGILAWIGLLGYFFGRATGWFAGILLAIHPIWWYESSRSFFPNVPFVSFFLLALFFYFTTPLHRYMVWRTKGDHGWMMHVDSIIAGVMMGAALAIRPSEVFWITGTAILAVALTKFRLPWHRIVLGILACSIVLTPFFVLQDNVYGNVVGSGYTSVVSTAAGKSMSILFPFGVYPKFAARQLWVYMIRPFWWWWLIVLASLVLYAIRYFLAQKTEKTTFFYRSRFIILAGFVAIWLTLFYGSWKVQDNPDPRAVTIGTSYLRYWLPIVVASVVPVAWWLGEWWEKKKVFGQITLCIAVALYFVVSSWTVMTAPGEGLRAIQNNLRQYDSDVREVFASTPPDAVIITERDDKLLFPDRSVVLNLRSEETYAAIPVLLTERPVYYYGITFPQRDSQYLRSVKLAPLGVTIDPILTLREQTLYRFSFLKNK